ncbi:MAG: PrsW family glutamic-type intramembrane protease [Dehalococcoidia bacterium]|nr:PrsW family glutamic-type intramembrane protease [Dehalococcoidia bacterium]
MSNYFMNPGDFFANPNLWGILFAILFGLFWLALLAPRQATRGTFWIMLVAGAVVFMPAIAWVQTPLQTLIGKALVHFWTMDQLQDKVLLAVVPQILMGGLVQEGFKLLPLLVLFYGVRKGVVGPKSFLLLGAAVGAGFAMFETQWVDNSIIAQGFTWETLKLGWIAYLPFFERFFSVAFHIGSAAFLAYGLARGRGWQYYLSLVGVHALVNYGAVLYQVEKLTVNQAEIGIAVLSAIIFGLALYSRWHRTAGMPQEPAAVLDPGADTGKSNPDAVVDGGATQISST